MNAQTKSKPVLNLGGSKLSQLASLQIERDLDIKSIYTLPQVRTNIDDLQQLADNIALHKGVLNPIWVHAEQDGRYRLIAGERRLRAAPMAGFTRIPAKIWRGLTDREICKLQVDENKQRKDLTVFDEARSVAMHVEQFGLAEAAELWEHSKAWASKRSLLMRCADPVLDLMKQGVVTDLETLLVLNDLHSLSKGDFGQLLARTAKGASIARDEARQRLQLVRELGPSTIVPPAAAEVEEKSSGDTGLASHKNSHSDAPEDLAPPSPASQREAASRPATKASKARADQSDVPPLLRERVVASRLRLNSEGHNAGQALTKALDALKAAKADNRDAEWLMYSSFLDVALPVLSVLGKPRVRAYLSRLGKALSSQSPDEIYAELHALAEGEEPETAKLARMPDDWEITG